jgi:O-antigen/teichoic acid export membrane protein
MINGTAKPSAAFLGSEARPDYSGRAFSVGLGLNVGWSLAGSLIYAGCQWATLIMLAKLGSPDLVGEFTLGLAVSAPVFLFAQLQLRGLQATDAKSDFAFGDYLALRLVATALAYAALIAAVPFLAGQGRLTAIVTLIATAKALDSIADVVFGQWQKAERLDAVSAGMSINGVATLAGVAGALVTTGSGLVAGVAYAAGSAVSLGTVLLIHRRIVPGQSLRPRWNRERLRSLTTVAVPLGFVLMLVSLNSNVPRMVLAETLGTRELGIFAAVSYFIVAGSTVINSIGQAVSPGMARRHAAGDIAGFSRALQGYAVGAALMGIGGVIAAQLFGGLVLELVYSPDYAGQKTLLTIVMAAAAVSYVASVLGYGMTAARCFKPQVALSASVASVTTISALALVPKFGASGAAGALICGSVAQAVGSAVLLRQHHRVLEGMAQ